MLAANLIILTVEHHQISLYRLVRSYCAKRCSMTSSS